MTIKVLLSDFKISFLFINWSVLTMVSLTSTQLLWKERCLNTSCFVFYSASHSLCFFFLRVSLSLIPPKSALMARAILFSSLRNHFSSRILILITSNYFNSLLIRKKINGRRVVIAAQGNGSVVIWLLAM